MAIDCLTTGLLALLVPVSALIYPRLVCAARMQFPKGTPQKDQLAQCKQMCEVSQKPW